MLPEVLSTSFALAPVWPAFGAVVITLLLLLPERPRERVVMAITRAAVWLSFIGWEFVGITSVLLVAFFHERTGPVHAALRVLVTYRICDIGLLFGALWLHHWLGTTVWVDAFAKLGAQGGSLAAVGVALAL